MARVIRRRINFTLSRNIHYQELYQPPICIRVGKTLWWTLPIPN